MGKKRVVTVLFIILVAAIVAAVMYVGDRRNIHKFTGTLYFFNEAGTSIADESREIRYRTDTDLPRIIVEEIIKGPGNPRLQRTLEKQVELLGIDMRDASNIVVNFSQEYISGDVTKDILKTYSVVKSLCEIYFVNSVKVIVEGHDIVTPDGEAIGYLTAADINLATDTNTTETRELKLYFTRKDYNLLSPEMRTIKVTDQQPLEQYIINELIKGPEDKEHIATLSRDTVLLSVDIVEDICFVNFKSSFMDKNSGTHEKEALAIYSIVDSLTELDSISRVQFLIDGKKEDMFGSINIGSMFGRNISVIGN